MQAANLAQLHRLQADRLGPRAALRCKRHGLYHDVSWVAYREAADAFALALVDYGIAAGERVAILSENRVEWLMADVGILAAGAVDVPIHAPLTPEQVRYQLEHSDARIAVASGAAQAEKIAAVHDALPNLELVITFDPPQSPALLRAGPPSPPGISFAPGGTGSLPVSVSVSVVPGDNLSASAIRTRADKPPVPPASWHAFLHRGRRAGEGARRELRRREDSIRPDDLATILYTSGTTGEPKGVMLTHGNLLSNAQATAAQCPFNEQDTLLSWLPYSHVYARTVDHYVHVVVGSTLCLAEGMEQLPLNLAEVQPTVMTAVPRFFERVWARFESLPADERRRKLRRFFGPRLRWLTSGGAALPKHVAQGFLDAGIQMLEGYGLTESSPVIAFNRLNAVKVGTVGPAIPGVEIGIAPDGEILTRGPHVMKGYWKNPAATAEAINAEGWLHTGDLGSLDEDGYLTITDRKKDIIVLSTGKNVAPQLVERLLVADPCIEQALVYGDSRPFLTALIVPNFAALEKEAAARGIACPSRADLVRCPATIELMQQRIDRCLQTVSPPERVKTFVLLQQPFSLQAEELTTTLKLRRRKIVAKYAAELEALYSLRAARG